MLAGRAEAGRGRRDARDLRRRYLNAHPSAEVFVNFKDFSFFRIRPDGAHLVAGFGRIVDLKPGAVPDRYFRCRAAAGGRAGRHRPHERRSSRRHESLCDAAARRGSRRTGAAPAAIPTGWTCRPDAMTLRLDFPRRIVTPAALRQVLKELADQARAAASALSAYRIGPGINQISDGIGLASPAFISIRSPDRGRKAILTVTATEARLAALARSRYAGSRRILPCKRRACITVPSAPTNSA